MTSNSDMKRSTRHTALRWVLVSEAQSATTGNAVALGSEKLKHLRKVLRMEWDEPVVVLDGMGRKFEGKLIKQGDQGLIQLESCLVDADPRPSELELVICLPKNSTMDWIVEKAVECGVTRITPIVSSRSVVKPDHSDLDKYLRRWQLIMDSAVEQSERLWRPLTTSPVGWDQWLSKLRGHDQEVVKSFAFVSEIRYEAGEGSSDAVLLTQAWEGLQSSKMTAVRVFIGPEGGLSLQEREQLRSAGFVELSLGRTVLRVETAVVSALTLARVARLV